MKVRLLTGPARKFAVVVSMNHVFGDGAVLYRLHSMLNPSAPIPTLIPERVFGLSKALNQAGALPGTVMLPLKMPNNLPFPIERPAAKQKLEHVMRCGWSRPFAEGGVIPTLESFGPPWDMWTGEINLDWLEEQKRAFVPEDGAPYVSTNDIICNWWFSANKADMVNMAVNTRGRVPGLTANHVGNYQVSFYLNPEEYSLANLRRAAAGFNGCVVENSEPGPGKHIGGTTNWSQGYQQLSFDGCTHQTHRPMFAMDRMPPAQIASSSVLLFHITEGKPAILVSSDAFHDIMANSLVADAMGQAIAPH